MTQQYTLLKDLEVGEIFVFVFDDGEVSQREYRVAKVGKNETYVREAAAEATEMASNEGAFRHSAKVRRALL